MLCFRKITALLMACVCFFAVTPIPEAAALTIQEEKELAEEFLQTVRKRYKIIEDPAVANYIQKIGDRIVAKLPPQAFDYHFYVIEQDAYNAFAGPAGNIFVHSGLFEALDHEGELAALLAHEIAHSSCRHIAKMIEDSKKTNIGTLAGLVAGILIGLGGASSVGSAVAIGSMAAGQSAQLAYTREKEMQADQIGRHYLQAAGYNLHSMLSLLKTIRRQEWFSTEQIPTYLRTHPATEERLTYLASTLSDQPAPPPKDSYGFQRARARLLALYGNPEKALVEFRKKVSTRPGDPMAHYGYGLALERNGNPKAAVKQLRIAHSAHPNDPYITEDLGLVHFLNGNYEKSLEILQQTARYPETGRVGRLYLGRAQLELGKTEAALKTFEQLVKAYPDYRQGLYFLGKSYAKVNDQGNAHYYMGLYHMKRRDREPAVHHFEEALKHLDDKEKIKKINEILKDPKA